ncbi:MAG: sulfatase [Planctomycetota bacterium]
MNARLLGVWCAMWLASPLMAQGPSGQRANIQRPNILFIFSDDHSARAISAYGSKINTTPNLDRLANGGMRFDHCLVTNAICGPSRACVLTGKYSHRNGFYRNGNRFDGAQENVAKILQRNGYQTAVIGKWHLGTEPTGFDHWEVLRDQGPYYNPRMRTADGPVEHTGYTTDIITELGVQWLAEQRDAVQPFFLMLQHKAPHRNWMPSPRHLARYDDETIPEPPTLFDDYSGRASPAGAQEMTVAGHLSRHDLKLDPPRGLTDEQLQAWNAAYGPKNAAFERAELAGDALVRWQYQRYIKDYLRCVDAVDESIGRVLETLDETGLADNTVVIYTSDQGWFLGEHGWYDKRWMYEESLMTPLLVRWPGAVRPGSVCAALTSNVDFAPTFLALAGVAMPDDMQGASMVPLLRGEQPDDWRTSFYYHYYEFPGVHAVAKHFGVRTARHKLIRYYQLDEWELFDLDQDPDELRNVYDDPAYRETRETLAQELTRLQRELGEDHPTAAVPGDPDYKG